MRLLSFTLASLPVLVLAGCAEAPPEPEVPVRYADPPPAVGDADASKPPDGASGDVLRTGPFEKAFEGITFEIPEGWREVKLSGGLLGFVDSRFVLPSDEGTVELTVLSSGGGIDENVTRWIGQFEAAPDGVTTETIDVDGAEAKWVDLRGTFNGNASGKPGPHPDWRMLGAGIPVGEKAVFLKLNGPAAAVEKVRDEFREFVKGARRE